MLLKEVTISPGAERMAYRVAEGILLHDLADAGARTAPYSWPEGYD